MELEPLAPVAVPAPVVEPEVVVVVWPVEADVTARCTSPEVTAGAGVRRCAGVGSTV